MVIYRQPVRCRTSLTLRSQCPRRYPQSRLHQRGLTFTLHQPHRVLVQGLPGHLTAPAASLQSIRHLGPSTDRLYNREWSDQGRDLLLFQCLVLRSKSSRTGIIPEFHLTHINLTHTLSKPSSPLLALRLEAIQVTIHHTSLSMSRKAAERVVQLRPTQISILVDTPPHTQLT